MYSLNTHCVTGWIKKKYTHFAGDQTVQVPNKTV